MNRKEAKKIAPLADYFGNGGDVQYRGTAPSEEWKTTWINEDNPSFSPTVEWRKKPEPRVFWINPRRSPSRTYYLTQEEYESGQWETEGFVKTIEDLSDD